MSELVRSIFRELSLSEAILAGVLFACVMLWPVAPRVGQVVAGWLGGRGARR